MLCEPLQLTCLWSTLTYAPNVIARELVDGEEHKERRQERCQRQGTASPGSYHEPTVAALNSFTHECSCSGLGFEKRSNKDAVKIIVFDVRGGFHVLHVVVDGRLSVQVGHSQKTPVGSDGGLARPYEGAKNCSEQFSLRGFSRLAAAARLGSSGDRGVT